MNSNLFSSPSLTSTADKSKNHCTCLTCVFPMLKYPQRYHSLNLWSLSPNLMNLSRVLNPPKPVSIERRFKSWNIEYNFTWNQPYLSQVLNLSRESNSLNSASDYARKMVNGLSWVLNRKESGKLRCFQ